MVVENLFFLLTLMGRDVRLHVNKICICIYESIGYVHSKNSYQPPIWNLIKVDVNEYLSCG